jgi:hypothetical protein
VSSVTSATSRFRLQLQQINQNVRALIQQTARLAVGREAIFTPPCSFCMENHE